jgi:hypothetical protein
VALVAAFAFRVGFGLASDFWSEDETQVFLLGLDYHSTGAWPYFGPDVVWTQSQIPGALQALLVGVPLDLVPAPESPLVLLNLLSFGGLSLLAWYICRRLPELPRWLVWGFCLTTPWTLHFSTHVVNPSYVLAGSIVFFVAALEALPLLRGGLLGVTTAHFMMGFALLWVLQVHMSWVLLPPFLLLALLARLREGGRATLAASAATLGGAALSGSLLVPTLASYGLSAGGGSLQSNLQVHWVEPWTLVTVLARFLSFASFEVNRFLGLDTARRLALLAEHPGLVPLAIVVGGAGIVQPLALVWLFFKRGSPHPEWAAIRALALGTVVLVYLSYSFSSVEPRAHAFYVVWPVAMIYSFYAWSLLAARRLFLRSAVVLLVAGVLYHGALALARAPERSLYKNRGVVATAIVSRTPGELAWRRPFARDASGPPAWFGPVAVASPGDLRVVRSSWRRALGRIAAWDFTLAVWDVRLRNEGLVAYRDLSYRTDYRGPSGASVGSGDGRLSEVIQPGQEIQVEGIADRYVDPRATAGEMRIAEARRILPLPTDPSRATRAAEGR